eukprot:TRINITY_DN2235_c0_g1_i4.p1 TRINITY_DN2235_c0_g1~~TRINITY_DN2235_c0_g1_i4.p1  ORF type:complete len:1522 (+),score=564.68 TRINITY_DN2235_c0_g1_i4:65-4630(+)
MEECQNGNNQQRNNSSAGNANSRFNARKASLLSSNENNLDTNNPNQLSIDDDATLVGDDDDGEGADKPGGIDSQHSNTRPNRGTTSKNVSKHNHDGDEEENNGDDEDGDDDGDGDGYRPIPGDVDWDSKLDQFLWIEDAGPEMLAAIIERQADVLSSIFAHEENENETDEERAQAQEEHDIQLESAIMELQEEIVQMEEHLEELMDSIADAAQLSIWKPDEMETFRQLTIQAQMQLLQYDLLQREITLHLPTDDDQANDILLVELAVIEQPVPVPMQIMGSSSSPVPQLPTLGLDDIVDQEQDSDLLDEDMGDEVLVSNTRSISTDSSSQSDGDFNDYSSEEILDDDEFFGGEEVLNFNSDGLSEDSQGDFTFTSTTREVGVGAKDSGKQAAYLGKTFSDREQFGTANVYAPRPREVGPDSKLQSKEWEDYVIQVISSPLCPFNIISSVHAFLIIEDQEQGCFVESEPLAEASVDPETGIAVFHNLQLDVQRHGLEYLTAVTDERPQFVQIGFAVEVEIADHGVYRVCSNLDQSYPCRFYTTDEEWLDAAGDMIWLNAVHFDQDVHSTSWVQLANSLQLHFLAQTFQDPLHPARALSRQDLDYLKSKFLPDDSHIDVVQFLGRELHDSEGHPSDELPMALWQWFGRIVEMMRFKPNLQAMWCQGVLFGLVSRADATDSLTGFRRQNDGDNRANRANRGDGARRLIGHNNQHLDGDQPGPGSCLIRFSERNPGCLVVVYLDSEDGRSSSSSSSSSSSFSSSSTSSSSSANVVVKNCLITQDSLVNDSSLANVLAQYPQFQSVLTVDPTDVSHLEHRSTGEVFANPSMRYIESHQMTTVISHHTSQGVTGYVHRGKFNGLINFDDLQYVDGASSSSSSNDSVRVTDVDSDDDENLSSRLALLKLNDENKSSETDSGDNHNSQDSEEEKLVIVRMIPLQSTLSDRVKMQLATEANMLSTIDHENVSKFYGFTMDLGNKVRLVHDFDQKQHHLADVMFEKHLNLVEIVVIAKGVASGMRCLVESCFPLHHGDLSAENILLDEESFDVKICDYGHSRGNRLRYRAPEVLKGDRATPVTDVYSFAMLLAEMLNQQVVFDNMDDFDAANAATYSGARPEIAEDVPASLETLLQACWSATPADRPSFADLEEFLDTLLSENIVNDDGVDLERELTLAEWQLHYAEREHREAQTRLLYANNQRLAFRRLADNIEEQVVMESKNITDLEEDLLSYLSSFEIEYDELDNLKVLEDREFEFIKSGTWRGTPVTVKELKQDIVNDELVNTFYLEISRMSKLRHKNLVLFMGACLKERLCIVTERLEDHLNLFNILHDNEEDAECVVNADLDERAMAHILSSVVHGIHHLHSSKPEFVAGVLMSHNVWLKMGVNWDSFERAVVKVDPFVIEHVMMEHARAVGDDNYLEGIEPFLRWMAPEMVLAMEEGLHSLSDSVDAFSLGTLIWEMVTGDIPFSQLDENEVSKQVVQQNRRPSLPKSFPKAFEGVLRACWEKDATKRPTDDQLLDQLSRLSLE